MRHFNRQSYLKSPENKLKWKIVKMLRCLCILAATLVVESAIAPFLTPCPADDNACILSSAQAVVPILAPGIPELNIEPVDPLFLPLVTSDQGGLELLFKDITVTGMKGCSVDAFKYGPVKGKQSTTIRCSVLLEGDYKMSGKLLVFPISGEGKTSIKIRDIVIKAYTDVTTVQGVDGKPHWHITKWRHTFNVKTNTYFNFENLFNGNSLLAKPILDFTNNNWRDVMDEIAPPVVKAIVARVMDSVEGLYKAVPVDELTLH